jgi:hypothetical protein
MKSLALVLLAACGSNGNVAGSYTIALTDKDNGCNLANWTSGNQTTGVPVTITQSGSDVNATVTGVAAAVLDAFIGTAAFTGDDSIDLKAIGTIPKQSGNCTWTYNGEITASLDGDALEGRIDYRAADNGNSDCMTMMIHGCDSYQAFNGTRPPE